MSTIGIGDSRTCKYIYICLYIYVQKNVWQPPEGKCHVLRRRCGMRALVTA